MFHSARWDHDHDVTGERVASVGTGASAIQFVPAIQPKVARLHVFQRTPPWVMPHPNRRITRLERRLYRRFPALQKLNRAGVYAGRELFVLGFVKDPKRMKVAEAIARRHMRAQIRDPRAARAGHARLHDRLQAHPAVERLVSGARQAERRARHERHQRGARALGRLRRTASEREVDTIIFGTGFQVTDMPIGQWVRGRGGTKLIDAWDGSPRAHLGSTIAGFPNLFVLLGPNTGLGPQLDGLHDRVADRPRARRAARDARARRRDRRGQAGGPGGVQPRARREDGGHGLEHRLRELVHRRERPQRDALARLDVALPPARAALRPGAARAAARRRRATRCRHERAA